MNEHTPDSRSLRLAKEAADLRAITAEKREAASAHRATLAETRAVETERRAVETERRAAEEIESVHRTANALRAALEEESRRAREAEALAEFRRQHIIGMETSLSWRITRPLRQLKRRLETWRGARHKAAAPSGKGTSPVQPLPQQASEVSESAQAAPAQESAATSPFKNPDPSPTERVLIVGTGLDQPKNGVPCLDLAREIARHRPVTLWLLCGELPALELPPGVEVLYRPASYAESPAVVELLQQYHQYAFAIVNGVEARAVLPSLASAWIPIISLVNDTDLKGLSSYTYQEVMLWSNRTVYASRASLEHAISWLPHIQREVVECRALPTVEKLPPIATSDSPFPLIDFSTYAEGQAGVRLVVGAGPLRFRHGADLFIDIAARLTRRPCGMVDAHFIWLATPDAEGHDEAYVLEITEQIRRAGLSALVSIALAPADLSSALNAADSWLLTARSDVPTLLPVHALRAGVPVVCFDVATMFAEALRAHPGAGRVAPYLDTVAAAELLAQTLNESTDPQEAEARQTAADVLSLPHYGHCLMTWGKQAAVESRQERLDAETILESQAFVPEYLNPQFDPADPLASVCRYVRGWRTGLNRRKPRPGFHPAVYRDVALGSAHDVDPFAHFLRCGSPEGPWTYPVIQASGAMPDLPAAPAVALQIHAFYPELVPDIVARLSRNQLRPDLFISVKDEEARQAVRDALHGYPGTVVAVDIVPNTGRDISPLLTAFGRLLCADYEIVGHIHTKQSLHNDNRAAIDQWRRFLFENTLGGPVGGAMMDAIIAAMYHNPELALVFPDDPTPWGWDHNLPAAQAVARHLGIETLPTHFSFPVGTMFWMRADTLRPFVELGLHWPDYPTEPLAADGTILHALERLFGAAPIAMDQQCAVAWVPGIAR